MEHQLAEAIGRVDPKVVFSFRVYDDQIRAAVTQERVVAILAGFFGGLALLLAALGLYGVTSYSVNRRRTEIGVRMALGANPRGVIRLVLGRVSQLVALGVILGVLLSWWASRFVAASLLFGLQPRDPIALATAVIALVLTGAVAGWLPARRASRLDPSRVLRDG